MNLTTIHHINQLGVKDAQTQRRESVYRVDHLGPVVRITVHRDRSYVFQNFAYLEQLTDSGEWTRLFTADQADVHGREMWETEDELLSSYAMLKGMEFTPFDTQGALYESGHLRDD